MSLIRGGLAAPLVALGLWLASGGVAIAQEISQSHLQVAVRVARAGPSTMGDLDALLPLMSEQVQSRLIRTRPDLFREIAATVEEQALQLAARRAELDNEIARIWARRFSEAELQQIAAFFDSELGAKYKEVLPQIGEELLRASRRWSDRLAEELYTASLADMQRQGHEF